MKKTLTLLMTFLLIFSINVFAGDIPEALIYEDDSCVFFGELVSYNDEGDISYVEVIPTKAVKGDIILNSPCSYQNAEAVDVSELNAGETYLFGSFTALNGSEGRGHRKGCIYVFEVTSTDTKALKIKGHGNWDGDPVTRLERYLNQGRFEEAEKNRIEKMKNNTERKEITVSEFLKTDATSVEAVTLELSGERYTLDKELFMKIAEKTVITPVINGKSLEFGGIYITVENKGGFSSYLYITPEGSVDMYSAMFSRLPFEAYRADTSFLKQLYAISPKEAQENFPEFNSESENTYILAVWGILIIAAGLLAGNIFLKRSKKRSRSE